MAKIPKQLYVTGQHRNGDIPLGFLNAYEPNKVAFEKKKTTQEDWAYNLSYVKEGRLEEYSGNTYVVGYKNVYKTVAGNYTTSMEPYREICEHPPQIWDNTPMSGFKIRTSVSRYSTSNKLWRILDPRNYEFEITTAVMEELIMHSTIKNGEIQEKCVWVSNKNLIVAE